MPNRFKAAFRNPAQAVRVVLGALLVLNLVAAGLVLYPPGGSAESLEAQFASLQSQVTQRRALIEQTRIHAESVEKGRSDGDKFLDEYFLARRTAYGSVLAQLGEAAKLAHVKEKENAFASEPVEGSETLSMMTITANYEGTYRDLMNFVREIDRAPGLLIIESLNAAPETGSNTLAVALKIQAFVREEPRAVAKAESAP